MGVISRFAASSETTTEIKHDKSVLGSDIPADLTETDNEKLPSEEGKQDGVKKVEAAAVVWTKWHLIAAFAK